MLIGFCVVQNATGLHQGLVPPSNHGEASLAGALVALPPSFRESAGLG